MKYNRDLMAATLKAMKRVSEIQTIREKRFYQKRFAILDMCDCQNGAGEGAAENPSEDDHCQSRVVSVNSCVERGVAGSCRCQENGGCHPSGAGERGNEGSQGGHSATEAKQAAESEPEPEPELELGFSRIVLTFYENHPTPKQVVKPVISNLFVEQTMRYIKEELGRRRCTFSFFGFLLGNSAFTIGMKRQGRKNPSLCLNRYHTCYSS